MITVNCMIRDEPLAFYAIASVAPYVDEVLVVDTGSDPKYLEPIRRTKELFPNVILHETIIENAHGWRRVDGETRDVCENAAPLLGDMRRCMHKSSKNPIIMILDGDEILHTKCAEYVTGPFAKQLLDSPTLECCYIPYIDLFDKNNVRHFHDMGRLFKKDKTYCFGQFPHEMHYSSTINWCLLAGDNERVLMMDDRLKLFACHYEFLVKPHRKPANKIAPFTNTHPEVFETYRELVTKDFPGVYEFMIKHGFYEN